MLSSTPAARLAQAEFVPHNRRSDEEDPRWDGSRRQPSSRNEGGARRLPRVPLPSYSRGSSKTAAGSWPETIVQAVNGHFMSANIATRPSDADPSSANVERRASRRRARVIWLPPYARRPVRNDGPTEPQAGSSLAEYPYIAEADGDGTWSLVCSEDISGGEQRAQRQPRSPVLAKTKERKSGRHPCLKASPAFSCRVSDRTFAVRRRAQWRRAGRAHSQDGLSRQSSSTMLNFRRGTTLPRCLVGSRMKASPACSHDERGADRGRTGAAMLAMRGIAIPPLDYIENSCAGRHRAPRTRRGHRVSACGAFRYPTSCCLPKSHMRRRARALPLAARLVDEAKTRRRGRPRRASIASRHFSSRCQGLASDYGHPANQHAIQFSASTGIPATIPSSHLLRTTRLNPIHEGTNASRLDLPAASADRLRAAFDALAAAYARRALPPPRHKTSQPE